MSILDPDLLIEKAQQLVRSDDLLGRAWEPAFRVLVEAVASEARLRQVRTERFVAELLGLLATRARIAALVRARPAAAEAPLPAPVVITGLPRTGTTLLHNLLARVPGHRGYRLWELRAPAFALGAPLDQARRELAATTETLEWLEAHAPGFGAIHPMAADAPDECNWLLRPTFTTPVFSWANHIPSYERFLAAVDHRPAYRDWELQLRLLRWRSPGGVPVLKDPGHLWALDALLDVRPDARVIVMVRDLREAVPSLCSLCAVLQRMDAEPPPPDELGRYVLAMVERGLASLARARDRAPDRFLAVEYRELVADPVGTTGAIVRWLGRALDPIGEARCRRFLATQPRHPRHVYTLADYGLDARDLPAA
ncbi:MAG TPA: sulfotransferase [Kofleriaceae bacterium]